MLHTKNTVCPTENELHLFLQPIPVDAIAPPQHHLTGIDHTAPIHPQFCYPPVCLPLNCTLSPQFPLKTLTSSTRKKYVSITTSYLQPSLLNLQYYHILYFTRHIFFLPLCTTFPMHPTYFF